MTVISVGLVTTVFLVTGSTVSITVSVPSTKTLFSKKSVNCFTVSPTAKETICSIGT